MSTDAGYFDMDHAPMRVAKVLLKVRDIATVTSFYRYVLGLTELETEEGRTVLGTPGAPLLELSGDVSLAPRDPGQAGLFHTAFLLPARGDLARWLNHAAELRIQLQGASDHNVSEAIYLADPEGNGIEIYVDRPTNGWRASNGEIHMTTDRLDIANLLEAAGDERWREFPMDGRIGHVHLQVGDIQKADSFFRDVLGFDIAARYPGASFYGSGGYHHQLAGNIWNSRDAGIRRPSTAGLEGIGLVVSNERDRKAIRERASKADNVVIQVQDTIILRDPWGTQFHISG